jgi:HK97 family phage prohead protease
MEYKLGRGPVAFKQDDAGEYTGEFQAIFSTLNVKDHDGDVTLPGAFKEGQKVRISYWGHRWQDLPVGRGEIHADDAKAWVDGRLFLDTEAGRETFLTVKNLGELQEWSYGFDIEERSEGDWEGDQVQFLRRLEVYEVSPVMLGAGLDTRTVAIKGLLRDALQGDDRQATVQELHDLLIEMGAKCAHGDNAKSDGDGDTTDQAGGQAAAGTSQGGQPSTLATRVAIEWIEDGYVV